MIRIASLLASLLLVAGCAAHREPAANCWQHRVAFIEAPMPQDGSTDCNFAPLLLPGPAGAVDV